MTKKAFDEIVCGVCMVALLVFGIVGFIVGMIGAFL